ncbi:MAG TPA: DUF533 domain-containing protein [bacterium]|nr:DUF533 domain-containing protein [bacterium]
MNFNRTGWFNRYLEFRRQHPLPLELPGGEVRLLERQVVHHEQDQGIYYFLQPSGMLYGFPVASPLPAHLAPPAAELKSESGVYWILLDSLLACMLADRKYLTEGLREEENVLDHVARMVVYFYEQDPLRAREGWSWLMPRLPALLQRRQPHAAFERILTRRLFDGSELVVPEYTYNGFLFLDLYFCLWWQRLWLLEPGRRHEHLAYVYGRQEQVRSALLQLLVAAAHSSGDVDESERRMFARFLMSSRLDAAQQARLRSQLQQGLTLADVQLPELPWLLRRHLLELTLMTLLADGRLVGLEHQFVAELVEKLGLWPEELEQCQSALEVFVLNHEATLHFMKGRSQAQRIADRLVQRASEAVRRNLHRVVTEVQETAELSALLTKSLSHPLTAEEKRKVRAQLLDILKTIPSLAIFALPGGAVILPIVIRLLPFNLLPSAFED